MTDFPILDAPRDSATADLMRELIDESLDPIEPHVDETDSTITMPLRIAHNAATGIYIELGPYDLDDRDIKRLREALRRYDAACAYTG